MRANRQEQVGLTDVVVGDDGLPVDGVLRFHQALSAMTGRLGLRNDVSRYESISLALIEMSPLPGALYADFPPAESPVHFDRFFESMYRRYDERYVVSAPQLVQTTRRLTWALDSPAVRAAPFRNLDYRVRLGD